MEDVNILDQLAEAEQQGLAALATVSDEAGLQGWKSAHLGRSAPVMLVFTLGGLPREDRARRRAAGQPGQSRRWKPPLLIRTEQVKPGCAAARPGPSGWM